MWAFNQAQKKPAGGTELYNTENKPTPEGLTSLPRDYAGLPRTSPLPAGVPQLGPPLPGDLVVTLGAGDVFQIGEAVLQNLGYATKTHEPA